MDAFDLNINKATILVVDDTSDNLVLMNNLLKNDYKVKIANSGEKALRIAMSDSPPDLILLDIMMPGMDGYEVCQQLKKNPNTVNIPLIFLTARSEMEDEQKGLELGAVDYITKPISPSIVMVRVKNHLALREKNIELEIAKTSAEKANLAKSEFLSSMSHELRSPLNAILGFAQLMETDSPPPSSSQKESIDQILQAGWHLLELINEILDLAKIESGKLSLSLEPISMSEVMHECQSMLESQADQHDITLFFPELKSPCFVHADRTRLKQIIINLLSNAIKYNKPKGKVVVDCFAKGSNGIRISVKDDGEGLSTDKIEQLFQPFNRLGQENTGKEGTGIGLVVAKQLVELMGGVIGVESTVGLGSTFWVELNADIEPTLNFNENEIDKIDPSSVYKNCGSHTILYVEDNPANMKLVKQLIARCHDLKLLTAETGYMGVELARDLQPEIILMDINLPDISGIEALYLIKNNPSTAHIPVVALSANAMARDIEKGMEAGFFRYLTKPINVTLFMETLQMTLEFAASQKNKKEENYG